MRATLVFVVLCSLFGPSFQVAVAKDISGPQVGEQVTGFKIRGVLDDERGQEIDLIKNAAGKPLLLVFVHERTRPALGLARQVLDEAASKNAGLVAGLVLLTPDVAATEEWVLIARQALPRGVTIGISPDGPLGPAAYNLNQKVQLTLIAAKDNRVVSNHAFTAPTPDDAPRITMEINTALAK
jgi:hypothetical protein